MAKACCHQSRNHLCLCRSSCLHKNACRSPFFLPEAKRLASRLKLPRGKLRRKLRSLVRQSLRPLLLLLISYRPFYFVFGFARPRDSVTPPGVDQMLCLADHLLSAAQTPFGVSACANP